MGISWREEYARRAEECTPLQELGERLLAIEAVSHVHPGVRVVEHLLIALAEFLSSDAVHRDVAVEALVGYISAWPPRAGAVETLEFVGRSLRWETLRAALDSLAADEAADFRNRDLARSASEAFEPEWHGGAYRSFP